jgi:hypothetical protein
MATAAGARVLARGRTVSTFYNRMRGGGVDFLRTKASSRGKVAVWPGYGGVWAATCGGRRANGVRRRPRPAREDGTRGTGLRLETASTVPCHSDQGTTHGPTIGGGPRCAVVLRRVGAPRRRRARRHARGHGLPGLISLGPVSLGFPPEFSTEMTQGDNTKVVEHSTLYNS